MNAAGGWASQVATQTDAGTHGEASIGYPPRMSTPLVTLTDWQAPANLTWSFQHMRDLMPHEVIAAGQPRDLAQTWAGLDLAAVAMPGVSWAPTVAAVLDATATDAFLVVRDGVLQHEEYRGTMTASTRHLAMSVTKSVVGSVAGVLVDQAALDPQAPLTVYVPELASSGYAGASVRTVLDMRSGIRFEETYLDPESQVRVMERSMGWAPARQGDPVGMYPYIAQVGFDRAHDGSFTYRSIDTDVLGWICERASGRPMPHLISDLIWAPMGAESDAEITLDPLGVAIHDGGLSATARDLARFGQLLCDDGRVGHREVVPTWWLRDTQRPPAGIREAFAASENEPYLPGGWYRNQFWVLPHPDSSGAAAADILCLGIHGQLIFVDVLTRTVCVKLSSWPMPQSPDLLSATLAACRALSAAGLP